MQRKTSAAKRFLQEKSEEIRGIDMEIRRKRERLTKLRARLTDGTSQISGMPGGGSGENSQFNQNTELLSYAEEINADVERLAKAQRKLAETIKVCEDHDLRAVLEKRYIDRKSWDKIRREMSFSESGIYQLHGRALKVLDGKLKTMKSV